MIRGIHLILVMPMPPSIATICKRYHIRPRRGFGQHFLTNAGVVAKIVRAIAPAANEPLLEIGPGLGVVTRALAGAGARVTAVEADRRMIEVLTAELGAHPRVRIVYGDILEVDVEEILGGSRRVRAVGNLPYNISSPILFLLREYRHRIAEAIVMLQREVANRLTAPVGTKDYGLLTIGIGVVGTCERLFDVAPGSFWPAPKVTSSVVRIRFPDPPPHPSCNLETFSRLTRAAFGKRRKTIRNALAMAAARGELGVAWRTTAAIEAALAQAGIPPGARPETLSIADYVRLATTMSE
ncbi:MAG: ribosomal RNA small subunit methyltransferase A [Deltaproteobacteria bacterium]|nr:ribosomal RNA small subunit methyltransferase A [Deltaproteobacteria bacterium]